MNPLHARSRFDFAAREIRSSTRYRCSETSHLLCACMELFCSVLCPMAYLRIVICGFGHDLQMWNKFALVGLPTDACFRRSTAWASCLHANPNNFYVVVSVLSWRRVILSGRIVVPEHCFYITLFAGSGKMAFCSGFKRCRGLMCAPKGGFLPTRLKQKPIKQVLDPATFLFLVDTDVTNSNPLVKNLYNTFIWHCSEQNVLVQMT